MNIKNNLYKEIIIEHSKYPKNNVLNKSLKCWTINNPTCGDSVTVQVELNKNKTIKNINQSCKGCAISCSSSSIMSELLVGKTLDEAINIINNFVKMVRGENYNRSLNLGEAEVYKNIVKYPARFKCATVSWEIMLKVLEQAQRGEN